MIQGLVKARPFPTGATADLSLRSPPGVMLGLKPLESPHETIRSFLGCIQGFLGRGFQQVDLLDRKLKLILNLGPDSQRRQTMGIGLALSRSKTSMYGLGCSAMNLSLTLASGEFLQ